MSSPALGDPPPAPSVEPGAPRAWQSGMQVATYSSVNLYNGNVQTVIPLVGWSGRGPDMQISLFHNSADPISPGGWRWRISYDGSVSGDPNDATVTVIEDDGTENVFTENAGDYDPPAGVYDKLEALGGGGWKLTRKNLFWREFDSEGRLIKVGDPADNFLVVARDAGNGYRISAVQQVGRADPNDVLREIEFHYYDDPNDASWELGKLKDLEQYIPDAADGELTRTWDIEYLLSGRVSKLGDPMENDISFAYDWLGRLTTVTDKEEDAFAYEYFASGDNVGRLKEVTDPSPFTGQTQQFAYGYVQDPNDVTVWQATVTDRGEEDWLYQFDHTAEGEHVRSVNPVGDVQRYEYDGSHNRTKFVKDVGSGGGLEWEFAYDSNGNLTLETDPLGYTVEREYDAFNNLIEETDKGGNEINYDYDPNSVDPTAVIEIRRLKPGSGSEYASVLMEYWGVTDPNDHPEWTGLPKLVTDANGVRTFYEEYDELGQLKTQIDGWGEEEEELSSIQRATTFDAGGRLILLLLLYFCPDGGQAPPICHSGGGISHNKNNQPTAVACCPDGCVLACPGCLAARSGPNVELTICPPSDVVLTQPEDGGGGADYDLMGRITETTKIDIQSLQIERSLSRGGELQALIELPADRSMEMGYDNLGRLVSKKITSEEPFAASPIGVDPNDLVREFTYDYSDRWTAGKVLRTGPDGKVTTTTFDAAGRVSSVTIGADPNTVEQSVTYEYLSCCGLLESATYGNDTRTVYDYDSSERVVSILHETTGGTRIKLLEYKYVDQYSTGDGRPLIYEIKERGVGIAYDQLRFYYDDWGRLTRETRDFISGVFLTPIYDYEYSYDVGGNRKSFNDVYADIQVDYFHDTDTYGEGDEPETRDNRLLYSLTVDLAAEPDPEVIERTDYYYDNLTGNIKTMVKRPDIGTAGTAYGTWFIYDAGGTVRGIVEQNWPVDTDGEPVGVSGTVPFCQDVAVERTLHKEFRYDSPRQRYLEREWQPKPYPTTQPTDPLESVSWPTAFARGQEYVFPVSLESPYNYYGLAKDWGDSQAEAEAYGGNLFMPNTPEEWDGVYRWVYGIYNSSPSAAPLIWLGAVQDPNAPDYSEPDGGWYWMTGEALEEWSNPAERPQNCDPNDPRPYPWYLCHPHEFGDGDRALLRPDAPPSPGTLMFSNWDDSGGTEEISYVIERPMFAMNEWRDYDGDAIYADWTVKLAALDPNTADPAPAIVHQRTYLAGVGFIDYSDPNAPLTRVLHADHLGTTRTITDATDAVVAQFFYNAWGVLEGSTGSAETRYGYVGAQGYQTDATTGLMHLGARYYDPTIGRFLQRDPIGIDGALNVYEYCLNNPTSGIDPSGKITRGQMELRAELGMGEFPPPRQNMSLEGWGSYIKRHRWDWDFGFSEWIGESFSVFNCVNNIFAPQKPKVLGATVGRTSWARVAGTAIGGNGSSLASAGRAGGRILAVLWVFEIFYDIGVVVQYPFVPIDY